MNNRDLFVNMHKSTTNRSLTNQPDSGIVSRSELGKRVVVNGHFGGVLRYMGQVAGKEGIFCGIELDQPVGKNDGTHEGAFYFGCRPAHGVFAPCHKVQIEAIRRQTEGKGVNEQIKESLNSKAERSLSRSAMPSLSSERQINLPSTSSQIPQMPMDWSLMSMSTVSNNSDCSYVIRTANNTNNIDLMANSQATYTVFESDCPMLSDLELSETSLLRLDEEDDDEDNRTTILGWIMNENGFSRTFRTDESVILDGPSLGMDLPIISSPEPEEEDMQTPMAETKTFSSGLILKSENKQNRSHLKLEGLEQQQKSTRKNNKELENKSPVTEMISFMTDGKIDNNNTCYLRTNVSSRNVQNFQREKEKETSKSSFRGEEKNNRISVFSIPMPSQNHSAAARAAKPKQPTKNQLVMEQLKKSMEDEKKRSKREVRSKLLSGIVTRSKGEKRPNEVGKSKSAVCDKSPSRQFSAESETTPTSTNDCRTQSKSPATVKLPSATRSVPRTTIIKPHGSISTPTVTSSTPNKISSFARISRQVLGSKENTAVAKENKIVQKKAKTPTNTNLVVNKDLENEQKKVIEQLQKDLKKEKKACDVFIILAKTLDEKNILVQEKVNKLKDLLEQNNLNYEAAIQKLEGKWKENLHKADELHKNEVEDVRSLLLSDHQNKLELIQKESEKSVKEYEDQIIAFKTQFEEQEEKYKIKLNQSETQRIQDLKNDLSSLSYALQLKTDELNKFRSENRQLLFKVEKFAEKEGLIIKLESKNEDLREEVNRLKQLERSLLTQLEVFRQQRDLAINKSKEIEHQKDVLEYQLSTSLNISSARSAKSTPTASIERPTSSCLSSRSHQNHEIDMSKSIDSALSLVKCYQQEGRSKLQNTPTKIYTNKECYELDDPPTNTIDFDKNEDSLTS